MSDKPEHKPVCALVEEAMRVGGDHRMAFRATDTRDWDAADAAEEQLERERKRVAAVRDRADAVDADLATLVAYVLRQSIVFRDGEYPAHTQAALRLQAWMEGKPEPKAKSNPVAAFAELREKFGHYFDHMTEAEIDARFSTRVDEPITQGALKAAGYTPYGKGDSFFRLSIANQIEIHILFDDPALENGSTWLWRAGVGAIPLDRVRTMRALHDLRHLLTREDSHADQ